MKVSISSAGLLISVCLSVALIGPFMRIFTMNVRAKRLLPILVAIFIGSNVVGCWHQFSSIAVIKIVVSFNARTILWRVYECGAVAPRGKQPQAIALVQAGLTIAVMIGAIRIILRWLCELERVFGVMIGLAIITMLGMLKFVPDVSLSTESNVKMN